MSEVAHLWSYDKTIFSTGIPKYLETEKRQVLTNPMVFSVAADLLD